MSCHDAHLIFFNKKNEDLASKILPTSDNDEIIMIIMIKFLTACSQISLIYLTFIYLTFSK